MEGAALHAKITRDHGAATCNQVVRLLAAVYRWHRDRIETELCEWPRRVAEVHRIAPRDWAYDETGLRDWWKAVSALGPIKRMWWLTALFTGERKASIEALRWQDINAEKRTIHFGTTKGNRPYSVPASEALARLLAEYRASDQVPPSEWVFPSNVIEGAHLTNVKETKESGVGQAHRLRHTFRTTLAQLGIASDQSRLLMGHSMSGDVSRDYMRPIANAVAERYSKVLSFAV